MLHLCFNSSRTTFFFSFFIDNESKLKKKNKKIFFIQKTRMKLRRKRWGNQNANDFSIDWKLWIILLQLQHNFYASLFKGFVERCSAATCIWLISFDLSWPPNFNNYFFWIFPVNRINKITDVVHVTVDAIK